MVDYNFIEVIIWRKALKNKIFSQCFFQANDSELRAIYEEELAVAKDAISNLRSSFRYNNINIIMLKTAFSQKYR
jgi:hypothetical protein